MVTDEMVEKAERVYWDSSNDPEGERDMRAALEAALSAQVQDVAEKKLEVAVNAMRSTIMSGSIWKLEEALQEMGVVDLLSAAHAAKQEGVDRSKLRPIFDNTEGRN